MARVAERLEGLMAHVAEPLRARLMSRTHWKEPDA
jgi:hypothetical protein